MSPRKFTLLAKLNDFGDRNKMGYTVFEHENEAHAWKVQIYPEYAEIINVIEVVSAERAALIADYDPTPYCTWCGAKKSVDCKCGPRAEND